MALLNLLFTLVPFLGKPAHFAAPLTEFRMSLISKMSCQLYSARNFPPLEAQLATLARLGYTKVEPFGGLYGDVPALAATLKSHNLTAPTAHFGLGQAEDEFEAALDIAQTLGVTTMVIPYLMPDQRPQDAAGWYRLGERLGAIRKKLQPHGISLAWHNHDFEFFKLPDGSVPLTHILDADPDVKWEADIGWIARAGENPLVWLARYEGRVATLHVKDIAAPSATPVEDGWADLGYGTIDWAKVIPAGLKAGAHVLVTEHDNPADFERFARRSIETAKSWAF